MLGLNWITVLIFLLVMVALIRLVIWLIRRAVWPHGSGSGGGNEGNVAENTNRKHDDWATEILDHGSRARYRDRDQ